MLLRGLDKKFIFIILTTIILMLIILFEYGLYEKKQLKPAVFYENTINKGDIQYNIDAIDFSNEIVSIKGWAIVNGINSYNLIPTIVLKDDTGNLYKLKTIITPRKDITKLFNGDLFDNNTHLTCVTRSRIGITKNKFIYDDSGIYSEFLLSELIPKHHYKIGIQLKKNDIAYFIWTSRELVL